MNRETLLPSRLLTSETMRVDSVAVADTNIQKADTVNLRSKKSRWQGLQFRIETGKNKSLRKLSSKVTEESTRSSTGCISTDLSLEPTSYGCMKMRTQAESICRTYTTSSSPGSNESPLSSRSSVTFSAVEFHTHDLILGDNPSVSVGPPIAMGWKAMKSEILDLEEYETSRSPRRKTRDLIVPRSMRVTWLRAEGYARSELTEVEGEIKVIKKHRRTSARKGLWEKVREVVSSNNRNAQDDDATITRIRRSSYDVLIKPSQPRAISR